MSHEFSRKHDLRRVFEALRARTAVASVVAVAVLWGACAAVYPELKTPLRDAPKGRELSPPPPADLFYITFVSAEIPKKTRDGRAWDSVGGNAPDPVAMLYVNDVQIIKTPSEPNTLTPTWKKQDKRNYHVPDGSKLRVEMWNSNALNNQPICVKKILSFASSMDEEGNVVIVCDSGARIKMRVEPARAKLGLGLFYELRTEGEVYVSRVHPEGPAQRAGIEPGQQIVKIEGREVKEMADGEAQSLINSKGQLGVTLLLKRADGQELEVKVKEGPIYPVKGDGLNFD